MNELRSAPIEGEHPYLYLDATYLDARWARKVENVSALVAYAVGPTGHRRLLGITIGAEESEDGSVTEVKEDGVQTRRSEVSRLLSQSVQECTEVTTDSTSVGRDGQTREKSSVGRLPSQKLIHEVRTQVPVLVTGTG